MMKIKNLKLILASLLMAQSFMASAAGIWAVADVTEIVAETEGTNREIYVNNFSNPGNCNDPSTLILKNNTTTAGTYEVVHTTILTGMIANKTIKVEVDGCTSGSSHPVVISASIVK